MKYKYCDSREPWSSFIPSYRFSLVFFPIRQYPGSKSTSRFVFKYQVIDPFITYFSGKTNSISDPTRTQISKSIITSDPWLVFSTFKVFKWLIQAYYDEKIKVNVSFLGSSNTTSKQEFSLYEGPSDMYQELEIWKYRMKSRGSSYLHSSTILTSSFQAFLVLKCDVYASYSDEIHFEKVSNIDLITNIEYIKHHKLISLPTTHCNSFDLLILCSLTLSSPEGMYVSANVLEVRHTAPTDNSCKFFGAAFLQVPQHMIYDVSKKELFQSVRNKTPEHRESRRVFGGLYDEYRTCENFLVGEKSRHSGSSQTLLFSTRQVIVYMYAYVPFLEGKLRVVLMASSETNQAIPLYIPLEGTSSLTNETLNSKQVEIMTISAADSCSHHIQSFRNHYGDFAIGAYELISRFNDHSYEAFYLYENALYCAYGEAHNMMGIIAVRDGENITLSNHPNAIKSSKHWSQRPLDTYVIRFSNNLQIDLLNTMPISISATILHELFFCKLQPNEEEELFFKLYTKKHLTNPADVFVGIYAMFYSSRCTFWSMHIGQMNGSYDIVSF